MAEKKPAQQANYAVYDLETTGLKAGVHGVCEIAIMIVDSVTLKELGRYESIIAPYDIVVDYDEKGKPVLAPYTVDDFALSINGLTRAKIAAGKPAKEVCNEIKAFEKSHRAGSKKCVLVGHNIEKFDNPHLDNMFESNKEDLSKIFSSIYFKDTQAMSHDMFPDATGSGQHTLAKLCERLGVDKFDAHSAMPDVIANAQAFIKIIKKMRGEGVALAPEEKTRPRDKFKMA